MMAHIQNVRDFNLRRKEQQDLIKVTNEDGNMIAVTKDEVKQMFLDYITTEFESDLLESNTKMINDVFDTGIGAINKDISHTMQLIDKDLTDLVNDKVDKITEDIVRKMLSSKIEAEVTKRVNDKLEQIKKML